MANPQKENGHVDIANEIVEALAKTYLSSYESQVLWAIFRKTYGWHKKEDWIPISQLMRITGIHKSHVSRTLKKLIRRSIIIKKNKKLSFQKNYEKWQKLPIQVTNKKLPIQDKKLPKQVIKVTQMGSKVTQIGGLKRNSSKETITKETYSKENSIIFSKTFKDFKIMRNKIKKPMTKRAEILLVNSLNKITSNINEQIKILEQSILHCWQSVYPLKIDDSIKSIKQLSEEDPFDWGKAIGEGENNEERND